MSLRPYVAIRSGMKTYFATMVRRFVRNSVADALDICLVETRIVVLSGHEDFFGKEESDRLIRGYFDIGINIPITLDLSDTLSIFVNNYKQIYHDIVVSKDALDYAHRVRKIRNNLSHNHVYDYDSGQVALFDIVQFLQSIVKTEGAEKVERIREALKKAMNGPPTTESSTIQKKPVDVNTSGVKKAEGSESASTSQIQIKTEQAQPVTGVKEPAAKVASGPRSASVKEPSPVQHARTATGSLPSQQARQNRITPAMASAIGWTFFISIGLFGFFKIIKDDMYPPVVPKVVQLVERNRPLTSNDSRKLARIETIVQKFKIGNIGTHLNFSDRKYFKFEEAEIDVPLRVYDELEMNEADKMLADYILCSFMGNFEILGLVDPKKIVGKYLTKEEMIRFKKFGKHYGTYMFFKDDK